VVDERGDVAVVMPAANAAATIAQALRQALAQRLSPREIIVVDDGSTDATAACVLDMMAHEPRIRLIRQARRGPSHARNVAIAQTSAAFIAPLDADDAWHPDYLSECVAALIAQPGAGMAYAWHHLIDAQGRTLRGPMRFDVTGGGFGPMLLTNYVGNGSSAVYRRKALQACGLYAPPLAHWHGAEDYLLQLRVAARSRVACVERDLVAYRKGPDTLSTDHRLAYEARLAAVRTALAEFGPACLPVERWAHSDACRTLAVQHLGEGAWGSAVAMACRALVLDPPAMALDLALRLRNLLVRLLGRGAGDDRPLDALLLARLRLLSRRMPFAAAPVQARPAHPSQRPSACPP
jgi:cellulose synthase/poly-beta-1,6-N-acetylglucosamine synthase-like glycosyltransferase